MKPRFLDFISNVRTLLIMVIFDIIIDFYIQVIQCFMTSYLFKTLRGHRPPTAFSQCWPEGHKEPKDGPKRGPWQIQAQGWPKRSLSYQWKNALRGLFKADKVNSLGPFPSIFKGCWKPKSQHTVQVAVLEGPESGICTIIYNDLCLRLELKSWFRLCFSWKFASRPFCAAPGLDAVWTATVQSALLFPTVFTSKLNSKKGLEGKVLRTSSRF